MVVSVATDSAPFQNRITTPPALQSVTEWLLPLPDGVHFVAFSHASIPTARSSLPSPFTSPIFSTAIPKCPLVMAPPEAVFISPPV